MMQRPIELLAPARDLDCGMAAIDHGADAVYMGAARFGARAAAGNSVDDIRQMCRYAHRFGAKVYVTVNTIIYGDEIEDSLSLILQLEEAGVDALLVQDMGLVSLLRGRENPLDVALHASTQTDNRNVDKVRWLRSLGFRRVVLARELSIDDIRTIHSEVPDVELEVFVHGALCVSYSGQCYASQHCFKRSANRGECAQFCRLAFDLKDSDGKLLEKSSYLLSLKDMCRIDNIEELLDAGACSLKIEGRLKDSTYVKNVTAAYSRKLDEIIAANPRKYRRASRGKCTYTFTPNLKKTFNRGFTDYLLHDNRGEIFSPNTPKAMGEYVGRVKEIRGRSFNVAGTASFCNGDGLCFINRHRQLQGFRVNRVEGNRLFPHQMPNGLTPGTALYRNNDQEFERLLSGRSAQRIIPVSILLSETTDGYALTISLVDEHLSARVEMPLEHQQAQKPQRQNIERNLMRLGDTPFECTELTIEPAVESSFIPSSRLAELRRMAVDELINTLSESTVPEQPIAATDDMAYPMDSYSKRWRYLLNASNPAAIEYYEAQGVKHPTAFETNVNVADKDSKDNNTEVSEKLLMQCRHCLRRALGYCSRQTQQRPPWRDPLYLELPDGQCFRLAFDCKVCQMNVFTS